VEQQRDAGQGRARFGRARMELRRGGSGQTRTEGNEVAHGGNLARTAAEGTALMQADHGPRGGRGGKYGAVNAEGEATQRHEAVGAGVTRRGFDTQRKTGGSGRSTLMTSQQVEWTAKLQDPEVRAELNRRVRECERMYFASGRLGSIPQASAHAKQQTTRKRVKGQWCESRTGTAQEMRPGMAILQEATRVCRPCFSNTRARAVEA
jgi:hypothetical protein